MSASTGTARYEQHTDYTKQVLESATEVPLLHGWLVSFASWLLLAGFVVFPGTFTNIKQIDLSNQAVSGVERWAFTKIQNLPLLGVAGICSGLGALGMVIFWIRWRKNYVIITDKVFLPGIQQGCAGVLSTVVNVYTAQYREWSIMARITVAVEGGCAIACAILFAFYWGLLFPTKRAHDKEMKERQGQHSNIDEEKGGKGQSPTIAKARPSRQGTTRSDRTSKGDSPVAIKRLSEFQATHSPTEEEVGKEDQPDIILTPKMPPFDQHLTGITQVNDLPGDESEEPKVA